jgi:hypothetical protein
MGIQVPDNDLRRIVTTLMGAESDTARELARRLADDLAWRRGMD